MLLLVIYLNVCCEGCNGGLGDNFAVYGWSTRAKLHFWWWRYQGMAAVLCSEWVYILLADLRTRTCASLALSLPEFFIIISCVRGMLFTDLRVKPLPSGLADRPCTAEAISVCVIFNIPDSNSFSLFCKFFAYCFLQAVNSSLCSRSIVFTLFMTLSCVCPDVCSVPVAAHPHSELCWTGLWPATRLIHLNSNIIVVQSTKYNHYLCTAHAWIICKITLLILKLIEIDKLPYILVNWIYLYCDYFRIMMSLGNKNIFMKQCRNILPVLWFVKVNNLTIST